MNASAKLLKSPSLIPRTTPFAPTLTIHTHSPQFLRGQRYVVVTAPNPSRIRASLFPISPNPPPFSSPNIPNSLPLTSLSISSSLPFDSQLFLNSFLRPNPGEANFTWNRAPESVANGGSAGIVGDKDSAVTVVLLGWLGAKTRHLKRYVEWYNSRGIDAVTFVVGVNEMMSIDLGTRLEKRISNFGSELGSWVSGKEKDGRERCLIFHTFSNTGWLSCGGIVNSFQGRDDIMEKIRGIVIDSGGGGLLDPKVWAAGFGTAVLKKRRTPINGSGNQAGTLKQLEKVPPKTEAMLLLLLEKIFSFLLNLPDVNRRAREKINALTEHPPPCPQLYLYSSGDTVVPSESIELMMEDQRRKGVKVFSYNFGSSPHVDHYRSFPDIYSSELHKFLRECFATAKQK